MPNQDLVITGFERVSRILNSWKGPNLRRSLRRAQRAALQPVLRDARRLSPVGETGNLQRNLKIRAGRRRPNRVLHRVTIEDRDLRNQSGVFYGGFVHFGTTTPDGVKQLGNPWLQEAAEANQNSVEGIMATTLRRELENQ